MLRPMSLTLLSNTLPADVTKWKATERLCLCPSYNKCYDYWYGMSYGTMTITATRSDGFTHGHHYEKEPIMYSSSPN